MLPHSPFCWKYLSFELQLVNVIVCVFYVLSSFKVRPLQSPFFSSCPSVLPFSIGSHPASDLLGHQLYWTCILSRHHGHFL